MTSRSVTKHIPYPYGVESTARDAVMVGIPTSESHKLHPSQCHARLVSVHVPSLHKSTITNLARRQANAIEFATKVCFSLFDGPEVMASGTKRKQCVVLRKLTDLLSVQVYIHR